MFLLFYCKQNNHGHVFMYSYLLIHQTSVALGILAAFAEDLIPDLGPKSLHKCGPSLWEKQQQHQFWQTHTNYLDEAHTFDATFLVPGGLEYAKPWRFWQPRSFNINNMLTCIKYKSSAFANCFLVGDCGREVLDVRQLGDGCLDWPTQGHKQMIWK